MSRARRVGHDGLPRIPYGDTIPPDLATETMLRRVRRRLAPGQQHVAWYGTPYGDRALYLVADSVELPPLRGKRAAAYVAARTCARCGQAAADPLPWFRDSGRDGRRLDYTCRAAETDAALAPERYRRRRQAVTWAADVVADGQAVIVATRLRLAGMQAHRRVHAATVAGEILVDARYVDPADIADQIQPLMDRPLIAWSSTQPLYDWRTGPYAATTVAVQLWDKRALWADSPARDEPSFDTSPADAAAAMRDLILRMAADDHPHGPPGDCPVLPETGTIPCGQPITETGHCVEHRRPYLLERLAAGGGV